MLPAGHGPPETMAPRKPAKQAKPRAVARKAKRPARRAAMRQTAAAPAPAMTPGAYVHIELYSEDVPATRRFYQEVFGWKVEDMHYGPGMTYVGYQAKAPPHGGIMPKPTGAFTPPPVLAYILVADVDQAMDRIRRAGGKIHVPKMEIPNVGWMAVFEAPCGVFQAVWQGNPNFPP